jgi:hypothetical protein
VITLSTLINLLSKLAALSLALTLSILYFLCLAHWCPLSLFCSHLSACSPSLRSTHYFLHFKSLLHLTLPGCLSELSLRVASRRLLQAWIGYIGLDHLVLPSPFHLACPYLHTSFILYPPTTPPHSSPSLNPSSLSILSLPFVLYLALSSFVLLTHITLSTQASYDTIFDPRLFFSLSSSLTQAASRPIRSCRPAATTPRPWVSRITR